MMDLEQALKQVDLLKASDWEITELEGWSNKTYLLHQTSQHYVLRLPIADNIAWIDREAERKHLAAVEHLLITPETLYFDPKTGVQLREYIQGEIISDNPTLLSDETIADVAFVLKKLHRADCQFKPLNIFEVIEKDYALIQTAVQEDSRYQQLIDYMRRIQNKLSDFKLVPCHMDPTPFNFLDSVRGMLLLDFEYSGACDFAWDLAYFITYAKLCDAQANYFLNAYQLSDAEKARVEMYLPLTQLLQAIWIQLQFSIEHYPADKNTLLEWEDNALNKALALCR